MQFNGLSIPQTNINQEFGLAEYVPTKHSGDLLIPHCFQGLFEVTMQDCKYHKVIFLEPSTCSTKKPWFTIIP